MNFFLVHEALPESPRSGGIQGNSPDYGSLKVKVNKFGNRELRRIVGPIKPM